MKLSLLSAVLFWLAFPAAKAAEPVVSETTRGDEMFAILQEALCAGSWVGVHAAEGLLDLNRPQPVREVFGPLAETDQPQYRVGVWRILSRAAASVEERDGYIDRIRRAELDADGPDQLHAIEALAKLGVGVDASERELIERMVDCDEDAGAPFAIWRVANAGDRRRAQVRLAALLASDDVVTRSRAGYVLRHLRPLDADVQQTLEGAIADEPANSAARPLLITAAGGKGVLQLARTATTSAAKYHVAMSLADAKFPEADAYLETLAQDDDLDVRQAAACACLRRRANASNPSLPAGKTLR